MSVILRKRCGDAEELAGADSAFVFDHRVLALAKAIVCKQRHRIEFAVDLYIFKNLMIFSKLWRIIEIHIVAISFFVAIIFVFAKAFFFANCIVSKANSLLCLHEEFQNFIKVFKSACF